MTQQDGTQAANAAETGQGGGTGIGEALPAFWLTIPGAPQGKGRPRFSRRSGRAYTPARTQQAEETLAGRVAAQLQGKIAQPLTEPLRVRCFFVMPVPASWSKKRQRAALEGKAWPTGKPDVDNLCKLLFDALNGLMWRDDSQIVELVTTKAYGEHPQTTVTVEVMR